MWQFRKNAHVISAVLAVDYEKVKNCVTASMSFSLLRLGRSCHFIQPIAAEQAAGLTIFMIWLTAAFDFLAVFCVVGCLIYLRIVEIEMKSWFYGIWVIRECLKTVSKRAGAMFVKTNGKSQMIWFISTKSWVCIRRSSMPLCSNAEKMLHRQSGWLQSHSSSISRITNSSRTTAISMLPRPSATAGFFCVPINTFIVLGRMAIHRTDCEVSAMTYTDVSNRRGQGVRSPAAPLWTRKKLSPYTETI